MAKEITFKIVADANQAASEAKSLKQQLREATKEAQNLIAAGQENTEAYHKARLEVAQLQDQLRDFNDELKALDPGQKFQAIAGVASSLAGGFQAAQGAMALFGAESKEVEQALLKVQAATALAQGIDQIREFGKYWNMAKLAIGDSAKKILTYVGVVEGATVAQNVLNIATKAFTALTSPLGLIIAGVTTAVAYFAATAKDTKEEVIDYNKVLEDNTKNLEDNQKAHETLRAELEKTNKEALKTSGVLQDATYNQVDLLDQTLTRVDEIDARFEKQRKELLKNLKITEKNIDDYHVGRVNAQSALFKQVAEFTFREGELTRQTEADKQLIWQTYNNQNEILQKQANDKQAEIDKKAKEEELARYKKHQEELDKLRLERNRQENANFNQQVANYRTIQEDYNRILSENQGMRTQMMDFDGQANFDKKKKRAEEELAFDKMMYDLKWQMAQDSLNIVSNLGNLLIQDSKKLEKFNKSAALVQIGIDTAKALSSALATANAPTADNIASGGIAGIAKYIALAGTITANALRAKQILQSNGSSGSAPSLGGSVSLPKSSGVPSTAAPNVGDVTNVGSQRVSNQTGQGADSGGQFKIYVTETDISDTQKRVGTIKQKAKVF